MIRTILLALAVNTARAGFGEHAAAPSPPAKPVPSRQIRTLVEREDKLMKLLKRQRETLIVKKTSDTVPALTRLDGILINSILAANDRPATFIVRIDSGNHSLEGAELKCAAMAPERRVLSRCDLLVINGKEHAVDARIWDADGGGILPDKYWSGEEKSFLTSSFAAFLGGVWDAARERVAGPFGAVTKQNGKNTILQGLTRTSRNAQNLISENGRKNRSVSFVNPGRRIKVFFNKSFKLKEVIP